jgi:hypothetical protein
MYLYFSKIESVLCRYRRPIGWADRAGNWHTYSMELCDEDRGVGDRECALMCTALRIQHRRPNGWADRGSNWYKHSLEQWAEVMGVGDRECALMRPQLAQTCAQHYTTRIGGQTAGPIGAQIDEKHSLGQWAEVMGIGDRAANAERGARERARSASVGRGAKTKLHNLRQTQVLERICVQPRLTRVLVVYSTRQHATYIYTCTARHGVCCSP